MHGVSERFQLFLWKLELWKLLLGIVRSLMCQAVNGLHWWVDQWERAKTLWKCRRSSTSSLVLLPRVKFTRLVEIKLCCCLLLSLPRKNLEYRAHHFANGVEFCTFSECEWGKVFQFCGRKWTGRVHFHSQEYANHMLNRGAGDFGNHSGSCIGPSKTRI